MKKLHKQYFVVNADEEILVYNSIAAAVYENEDSCDDGKVEIYEAVPSLIGSYKLVNKVVKITNKGDK